MSDRLDLLMRVSPSKNSEMSPLEVISSEDLTFERRDLLDCWADSRFWLNNFSFEWLESLAWMELVLK